MKRSGRVREAVSVPAVRAFALARASARLVITHPRAFLLVQAPAVLALSALTFLLRHLMTDRFSWASWAATSLEWLVILPASVAVNALGLAVARAAAQDRLATWRDAVSAARARYANLFVTSLLAAPTLLFTLGILWAYDAAGKTSPYRGPVLVACYVGGLVSLVLLSGRWELSHAISLFEDRSPAQNYRESSRLTSGSRVRIVLALVLIGLVGILVVGVMVATLLPHVRAGEPISRDTIVWQALDTALVGVPGAAWAAALQVVLYERLTAADKASPAPPLETLDERIRRRTAARRVHRVR